MAWENFFICQKPQEALQGKLFFQKKFKTTASKINCHISFHGQKQQNLVYWYTKSPQVQRECNVLAAVLECILFWLVSGYPQWIWQHRCQAGRISCCTASSGAYKSLCIHKTLSFIHFFKTGIWSCIFLVIGITWSYLFLVWSRFI